VLLLSFPEGFKVFPASKRENGTFEFWSVRPIFFSFLLEVVALVFMVIFQRKKQKQKQNKKKRKSSHMQIGPIIGQRLS